MPKFSEDTKQRLRQGLVIGFQKVAEEEYDKLNLSDYPIRDKAIDEAAEEAANKIVNAFERYWSTV